MKSIIQSYYGLWKLGVHNKWHTPPKYTTIKLTIMTDSLPHTQ